MPPLQSLTYSIPYVIVFFILYIAAIPVGCKNKAPVDGVPQTQLLFLVLFFFIGLRGYIFTDWKNYVPFWESCPSLGKGMTLVLDYIWTSPYSVWEKGFVFYGVILKTINSSWIFFQTASFVIDFWVLYYFFRRYNPDYIIFAFCVWYIFNGVIGLSFSINLLRNSKSLLFFLFSIKYLKQRKCVKYMLFNVFGMLFHVSSIIYIPLYFVLYKRWNDKIILGLFLLGNLIYLLQIKWCIPVIGIIADIFTGRISNIAQTYLLSEKWATGYGLSIGFIERTATFILFFCFRRKLMVSSIKVILYNALYLYVFSYLYLSEMSILTDRIPLLFIWSYWFLFPELYSRLKKDYKILFLLLFLLYSILKIISANRSILVMYDNFLFQNFSFSDRILYNKLYFGQ